MRMALWAHSGSVAVWRRGCASSKQCLDHMLYVEIADIFVRLSHTNEDDGLARRVDERKRGAYLVTDRVELGQHKSIDEPRRVIDGVINQGLVEPRDLIDSIV